MKNTFGKSVSITIFGESHGKSTGIIIDGLAPGIKIDEEFIAHQLTLRRPSGEISTSRVESDPFEIHSGVFRGYTTGTPLCIIIPNTDVRTEDYTRGAARPSHADYTAYCKYHGYEDYRGGGHFSGRLTAPLVAAGAIAISVLKEHDIHIGTHIKHIGGVYDRDFADMREDINTLSEKIFAVLDEAAGERMQEEILRAKEDGDSIGGVLESAIIGLPAGLGEPVFDSVESELAHAVFSVPAIKGVEFGDGFGLGKMRGSQANDKMRVEDDGVVFMSNHGGGVYGGITSGWPVIMRTVVKPTPTIGKVQESISLTDMKNIMLEGKGRHDPCIVHRARVVVDSVIALTLLDMLAMRYGTDRMVKR